MDTTEHIKHIKPLHAPPGGDEGSPEAEPSVGVGTAITLDYLPIAPFLLIVAIATLAFIPAFAAIALLVALLGVLALPFLIISHFVRRR
jgi:hypothetical protein